MQVTAVNRLSTEWVQFVEVDFVRQTFFRTAPGRGLFMTRVLPAAD